MSAYLVKKTEVNPTPADNFDSPVWSQAGIIELKNRYLGDKPEHGFTPYTSCRLLHGNGFIFGRYRVQDRYILIRAKKDQDSVCLDSCVEFFVRPKDNPCYFNFEFSGGTVMLLYCITPTDPVPRFVIPQADCDTVLRYSTLPRSVDPETSDPVTWEFFFAIPVSFFVKNGVNVNPELSGQTWTANITKCADDCSHPCWLSWQPLPKLNFHQPDRFTEIRFE
jgi:hypothetical protein